jgi:hypothetical protein
MKLQDLFEAKSSGKSTAHLGTVKANKDDILKALQFVSQVTNLSVEDLKDSLLGSTKKTLAGKQEESGDIDIAIQDQGEEYRNKIVKLMLKQTNTNEIHRAGDGVFSFAVPVNDKKVQVDLMFVKSKDWAKWSYHSDVNSKYKAAVRSLLFVNVMKQIFEKDKDLEVKDEGGDTIIRVRRSFKADVGLERLFKVKPMRKDGKGRTKTLAKSTAKEVQKELDKMGLSHKFDPNPDNITDPEKAARLMFGKSVKAEDVKSVEQVISLIKKRKDADIIFKNTADDLKDAKFEIPPEIKSHLSQ